MTSALSGFIWRHRLLWLLAVGVAIISLDQGTKIWAQTNLTEKWQSLEPKEIAGKTEMVPAFHFMANREIIVIPHVFNLVYKENPAAAFNIALSLPAWFRKPFLLTVSLLATFLFIAWYFRLKTPDLLLMSSFCLIIAGALGNLIDRASLGYVVDFLDVYAGFLGFPHSHWPTFNVADSSIVCGAMGVSFRTLRPLA